MMKRILAMIGLGLLLLACWGCGAAPRPDTVSYVLEAEPSRLDPAMTTALPESNVELQIFEGLTRPLRGRFRRTARCIRFICAMASAGATALRLRLRILNTRGSGC